MRGLQEEVITHRDRKMKPEWQEGPSQPGLQEDRPQAKQKHPCQGPDAAPSGTCRIAEVCVTAGNLGVDGEAQDFQSFRILLIGAGGRAELVY